MSTTPKMTVVEGGLTPEGEDAEEPLEEMCLSVTVITVALSILLHGVSAAPLARRYGRFAMTMSEREEMKKVTTVPLRTGMAD